MKNVSVFWQILPVQRHMLPLCRGENIETTISPLLRLFFKCFLQEVECVSLKTRLFWMFSECFFIIFCIPLAPFSVTLILFSIAVCSNTSFETLRSHSITSLAPLSKSPWPQELVCCIRGCNLFSWVWEMVWSFLYLPHDHHKDPEDPCQEFWPGWGGCRCLPSDW